MNSTEQDIWSARKRELADIWRSASQLKADLPFPDTIEALENFIREVWDTPAYGKLGGFLQSTPDYDPQKPFSEQSESARGHITNIVEAKL